MVTLYSSTRSSADVLPSAPRSEHSREAARSDAKASRCSRRHALLVTHCVSAAGLFKHRLNVEPDKSMIRYHATDIKVADFRVAPGDDEVQRVSGDAPLFRSTSKNVVTLKSGSEVTQGH